MGGTLEPRHLAFNEAAPMPTTWTRPATEFTRYPHTGFRAGMFLSRHPQSFRDTVQDQTILGLHLRPHTQKEN